MVKIKYCCMTVRNVVVCFEVVMLVVIVRFSVMLCLCGCCLLFVVVVGVGGWSVHSKETS